ncbi:hypothetical protein BGX26_010324 [Mortierella sp. AD094]|nr:hypothetical protein BGX26_010324 [Mortierella sp. AD094]
MVKFTALLLASVAILAVSTNAQVSTEPRAITIEQAESYTARSAIDSIQGFDAEEIPEDEANMVILPYPGPHNESLERRAAAPTKPAPKLTKEQQTILDTHNKYRALHQAPPLKWNAKAATFGNNWIQQCKFQHSGGPHGENLAAGYKDFKTSIDAWYNEVKMYNYNRPGFSGATGHFTQVVWKDTKTVGCAKKFCPGSNWYIYICEYDPPGNIVSNDNGYFRKNVLPAKKASAKKNKKN